MHKHTKDQLVEKNLELEKELVIKDRELEIEAALEKVRSRMLRMQKSVELEETTAVMYQQLDALGVVPEGAMVYIVIIDDNTDTAIQWVVSDRTLGTHPEGELRVPMTEDPRLIKTYEAWKQKDPLLIRDLSGDELDDFKNYFKSLPSFYEVKTEIDQWPDRLVWSEASFSNGTLGLIYITPLPEATLNILVRFSKVFDLTYTRFLDLQKAEAQTREAQIENAMEKVRSRTMAMQRSEELADVATVLFQQVKALGISQWTCGFTIWEIGDKESIFYPGSPDGEILPPCRLPLNEHPVFMKFDASRRRGDDLYIYEKEGEVQEDHYRYMLALPGGVGDMLQDMLDAGLTFPTFQIDHLANFSHGNLIFITYEHFPEMHDVFKRFAKVFEQTYTRFLDLQKAEEQAKEAQIEVALEKVRSRSMAMHRSEELLNVIKVVSEQLLSLNFKFDNVSFGQNNQKHDYNFWLSATGYPEPVQISVPFLDNPIINSLMEAHNNNVSFLANTFSPKDSKEWFQHLIDHGHLAFLPEATTNYILNNSFTRSSAILENIQLFVGRYGTEPYSDNENKIIARFAQVFEQSFTRFLDLQKAEEQAKEAQIETALERLRSRSLGMHKSEELNEVIFLLNNEMLTLGVGQHNSVIGTDFDLDDPTSGMNIWIAAEDATFYGKYHIPYFDHPLTSNLINAHKNDLPFYTEKLSKEEKDRYYEYIFENSDFKETASDRKKKILNSDGLSRSVVNLKNSVLGVQRYSNEEFSAVQNEIIKRFGFVFEQAYTRFLDLKKAEEQAEEAMIEASLEKVRSRSMAMHKTEELLEVIMEVFTQFKKLNLDTHACWIDRLKKGSNGYNLWIATPEGAYPDLVTVPYIDNPMFNDYIKAKKTKTLLAKSYTKPIKDVFYRHLFNQPTLKNAPKERVKFIIDAPEAIFAASITDHIGIGMTRYNMIPFSDKENDILKRFTKVFDQSYTRFLDIEKAEAQAREAQIEAALEKVRSRTIGMQQSEELQDAAMVLFEQVEALGVQTFVSGFNIWEEDKKHATAWMAGKHRLQAPFKTTTAEDIYLPIFEAEQRGEPLFIKEQGGEELEAHYKYLIRIPEVKAIEEEMSRAGVSFPGFQIIHCAFFSKGYLMFISYEPVPEAHDIFKRFAKVFEQTYTRFLDLQKAENQVREAQIEASLERVRAKAMAMHSSEDLINTVSQLFKEFNHLDISFIRCGVLRILESREAELYAYGLSEENETVAIFGNVKMTGHELMDGVFEHWKLQKEYVHELKGNALKRHYELVSNQTNIPISYLGKNLFGHFFYFPEGSLYCFANEKLPEGILRILRRFNRVMGLTYRRYLELQESEARELVAIKESSLDRVRAEIASMRTSADLERITPLIWKELTALGVSFYRCGVFIMEEDAGMVKAYLSVPTGESLAALHLDLGTNSLTKAAFKSWKEQKVHQEVWTQQQFVDFTKSMMDLGQIKDPETFQQGKKAPEKLSLHLAPFKQGLLYVGSTTTLSQEQIELVQSLADTFAEAYARYEDFNQLEDAKAEVENTLTDLKSAQSQLIQSEKMASLGELTAGIAHEIQNPLNFVTNFSEVSEEMLEELADEIKNNSESAIDEIMTDIKQNLSKINHHGKRASSIVKGMLDHSRTSSGTKELTDINVLADEYLRLAYHGLRAKDKSFQAEFTMDPDPSIPKISIIPQDFGRVILNLINNAFYAVNKKGKATVEGYQPLVTVTTKKTNEVIKITIKDNGEGIPREIVDKIFQPFFTTKPTGEGTGLGLSLAYDIITKGHGGTITVESKKRDYTEFIIELPLEITK